MRRPSFMEGVAVALVASLGVGILFPALTILFAPGFVLRLLIAATGLLYVLYLLRRSGEKVGRISSAALWSMSAALIWLMGLSLPLYLLAHLGLVWLIRSLYYHASLISALLDLALVLFGLAAAVWAMLQTESLFLTLWSFFLVQALFVVIPDSWKRSGGPGVIRDDADDPFQQAYRTAQAALAKLSTLG
ncbi:MAG: hypothetical protein AB2728_15550 [Candidatus Thiodiazotropha sp.]|nr:hypothetical protein [Candidatus Thiodiazotropha taylori]MBT3059764.1 hypothetical protein [Candidatus Thiodiazotropha sp. (ex Lucina pensylvanica)]MBT3063165.1 hypothetical protein [Candidatus Thiodiazotropha sp. (ex Lucina pensylvanica)]MBV2094704.1 hypothetical protein [Candidatus Thiodiazotropha sp. (ex Codakia orbicularis)]